LEKELAKRDRQFADDIEEVKQLCQDNLKYLEAMIVAASIRRDQKKEIFENRGCDE
jgi:menaquinone-dependent protoporphyrinogen IX oxidase